MIKARATIEIKYTFDGSELVEERNRLNLSQQQTAEKSGMQRQNIAGYESPIPHTIRQTTKAALEAARYEFEIVDVKIPIEIIQYLSEHPELLKAPPACHR